MKKKNQSIFVTKLYEIKILLCNFTVDELHDVDHPAKVKFPNLKIKTAWFCNYRTENSISRFVNFAATIRRSETYNRESIRNPGVP